MNLMAKFTNINRDHYFVIYSTYDYLSLKMVIKDFVVPKTPSPDEGMNNKKIYIIPYVISIIIFIFIL